MYRYVPVRLKSMFRQPTTAVYSTYYPTVIGTQHRLSQTLSPVPQVSLLTVWLVSAGAVQYNRIMNTVKFNEMGVAVLRSFIAVNSTNPSPCKV